MKDTTLDAAADGNFGSTGSANRRAGYTDPLGWALKIARQGGTLAAGEGGMIIEYYEEMMRAAFIEGWYAGFSHGKDEVKAMVMTEVFDAWESSGALREAKRR